jgi:hypothetical protein
MAPAQQLMAPLNGRRDSVAHTDRDPVHVRQQPHSLARTRQRECDVALRRVVVADEHVPAGRESHAMRKHESELFIVSKGAPLTSPWRPGPGPLSRSWRPAKRGEQSPVRSQASAPAKWLEMRKLFGGALERLSQSNARKVKIHSSTKLGDCRKPYVPALMGGFEALESYP